MKHQVFVQGLLQTNCTVVWQGNSCLVVDVADGAQTVQFVQQQGLHVEAVLLTHGHFDHCGGAKQLLDICGASPVFVHKADLPLCLAASRNRWAIPAEDIVPTNFLQEGQLQLGQFCLQVVHTAGHTAGSVCFVLPNLLLCGDTLMKGTIGRTDFPESVPSAMAQSLRKLKQLQGDFVVVGGHGPTTTLNYEKEHNPFLR